MASVRLQELKAMSRHVDGLVEDLRVHARPEERAPGGGSLFVATATPAAAGGARTRGNGVWGGEMEGGPLLPLVTQSLIGKGRRERRCLLPFRLMTQQSSQGKGKRRDEGMAGEL